VSTDGYEVTNLVSSNVDEARKGFLAYYAIKPPVTITINFFCSVNVSHIILWSQIGCQKSTGFEIYVNSAPKSKSQDYQKAAFGYLEDDEIGVIFYRRASYHECIKYTKQLNSFAWKEIAGSKYSFLSNAVSLQVKIIKTKSSVPALARVEVWGKPSKSCDPAAQHNVFKLWADRIPKKETLSCDEPERQLQAASHCDVDFEIPEEFLDSITCTVMSLPYILPCGKVVDRSTLNRHEEEEAKFGRSSSDPFTGRIFTENHRPVPATALKARIDKFLIDNSERQELTFVPRTTGRRRKSDIHEASCSNVSPVDIKLSTSVGSPSESKEVTCLAASKDVCQLRHKRPSYRDEDVIGTKMLDVGSYEEKIDWSLDSALKSTLAGLPTYTRFNDHVIIQQCAACNSDNMLFKLPCKHFLCRVCLVLKKECEELLCNLCKARFQSSDPLRYHL
jgi:U-box domain-containing protein 5